MVSFVPDNKKVRSLKSAKREGKPADFKPDFTPFFELLVTPSELSQKSISLSPQNLLILRASQSPPRLKMLASRLGLVQTKKIPFTVASADGTKISALLEVKQPDSKEAVCIVHGGLDNKKVGSGWNASVSRSQSDAIIFV
jgi:hypothetical protein